MTLLISCIAGKDTNFVAEGSVGGPIARSEVHRLEIRLSFEVEKDVGQEIGTLFEIENEKGVRVFGAGLPHSHQSRRSVNNRFLEFWTDERLTEVFEKIEPLVLNHLRSEPVTLDGTLVDLRAGKNLGEGGWEDFEFLGSQTASSILNAQMIGDLPLVFAIDETGGRTNVVYGESTVLSIAENSRLGYFYKNKIYVVTLSNNLVACEWDPTVDTKCGALEAFLLPQDVDFYSILGFEDSILIGGGDSLIYRLHNSQVEELFRTQEPGEFYSFLTYRDKILAGHYPSGYVYAIDPEDWSISIFAATPLLEGQGPYWEDNYQEAQALMIYDGNILVGMYPWGILWEFNPDHGSWRPFRMFTAPDIDGHYPYSRELQERGLSETFWGQRITGIMPYGNGVAIGLGNMRADINYTPEHSEFMTSEILGEYGSIVKFTRPSVATCITHWPQGERVLEFVASDSGLKIIEDQRIVGIASYPLSTEILQDMHCIRVGDGTYGKTTLLNLEVKILSMSNETVTHLDLPTCANQ